jgi:hypothetical protein
VIVRLSKHDVVCTGFAGEHGIMPASQSAGTCDARRLERRERDVEGVDAAEVGPIGAGTRHNLYMAIKEECRAPVLHDCRKLLDPIDLAALASRLKLHQHGRDIRGCERRREIDGKSGNVPDPRCDEVEARGGSFVLPSSRHDSVSYAAFFSR